MNKTFINSYRILFLQVGLLVVAVMFVSLWILSQGVVNSKQQKISFAQFLIGSPKYIPQLFKKTPEFNFIDSDSYANQPGVSIVCVPECQFILSSESYDPQPLLNHELVEEPVKYENEDGSYAWVLPARALAADAVFATKLGTVIWDETRSTIVYEIISTTQEEVHHHAYVWQYSQDWSMGLLHWFKLSTEQFTYKIEGYDSEAGYLKIGSTGDDRKAFAFSISGPSLLDLH